MLGVGFYDIKALRFQHRCTQPINFTKIKYCSIRDRLHEDLKHVPQRGST